MLELVPGESRDHSTGLRLWEHLKQQGVTGTLYLGYPVFADAEGRTFVDALLLSEDHSAVVFMYASPEACDEDLQRDQDSLYVAMEQRLKTFEPLRQGRALSVPVHTVSLLPSPGRLTADEGFNVVSEDRLNDLLPGLEGIDSERFVALSAAIQRVKTIRPSRKRTNVTSDSSRGGVMREIERQIANLDYWQNVAAIGTPDGPQRIRGIAGSGKTIVLALKAAYLHVANPDWTICVTFQTRSLYEQFRDLIRRFCFDQTNEDPDWSKMLVRHAWGSASDPGVYSDMAGAYGSPIANFGSAKERFGAGRAFEGVCHELLGTVRESAAGHPLYDALLIDEAQDFPQPFFELAYAAVKDPKRIVWAYDELQNLGNFEMMPPEQLFGTDLAGAPRVQELRNAEGEPVRDAVLPVCYRNTPWTLTAAHALGLGLYRGEGLVQFYSNHGLWDSIGYERVAGEFQEGKQVTLSRRMDSAPRYVRELLDPSDAVSLHTFGSTEEQAAWVADQIALNLSVDELQHRDVLVVLADPLTARPEAAIVMEALKQRGVVSHLAGVTSSRNQLFVDDSIAISGIYRAKGNEAPMVYLLNAEFCHGGFELIKKRNILFTAMTRSRAWMRVCGVGEGMSLLREEFDRVVENEFKLQFRVPTHAELAELRRVHGEMTTEEKSRQTQLEQLLSETDETIIRRLPKEVQQQLRLMLSDAEDANN